MTEHSKALRLECGHEQRVMSVAVYGGWQEFPMRCLECPAEWDAAGRCYECGTENATARKGGETKTGTDDWEPIITHVCDKCWREWNRASVGHCAKCGRFVREDHESVVEVGMDDGYYDPYWGPQPPEPKFELRCSKHRDVEVPA
jgi:hypothetical protein